MPRHTPRERAKRTATKGISTQIRAIKPRRRGLTRSQAIKRVGRGIRRR